MEYDLNIEVTKESLIERLNAAGDNGVLFEDLGGFDIAKKRALLGYLVNKGLARFENDDTVFSYRFFTTDGDLYQPQSDGNLKYRFKPRYMYGDAIMSQMADPFDMMRSEAMCYIGKYVVSYFPECATRDHSYRLERKQLYCFVNRYGVIFHDDSTISHNIAELQQQPLHEATYARIKKRIEERLPVNLYSDEVSSCFVGCRGRHSSDWFYSPSNSTWKTSDATRYPSPILVFNTSRDGKWVALILERSGDPKRNIWYIKTGANIKYGKGSIYYRVIEPIGLQEEDLEVLERREFTVAYLPGVMEALNDDIQMRLHKTVQMSFDGGDLKTVMLDNPVGTMYPGTEGIVEGLLQ